MQWVLGTCMLHNWIDYKYVILWGNSCGSYFVLNLRSISKCCWGPKLFVFWLRFHNWLKKLAQCLCLQMAGLFLAFRSQRSQGPTPPLLSHPQSLCSLLCFIFPYLCLKMTLYYDSIVYVTLNGIYLFIVPLRLHAPEEVWTTYGLINTCILKTKDYFSCVENENYNSFSLYVSNWDYLGFPH